MTDSEHGIAIRAAVVALNDVVERAATDGLNIKFHRYPKRHWHYEDGRESRYVLLMSQISRVEYV